MQIFTSRYQNRGLAEWDGQPIGITRYPPRFPGAFDFVTLRLLAPSAAMLKLDDLGEFERQYIGLLDGLGVDTVLAAIRQASGGAAQVALLCYEPSGEPCHRRLLAAWLRERASIEVEELPTLPTTETRASKQADRAVQASFELEGMR